MTEQMVIEHIGHLAGDYKCWDNTITREESLILCNLLDELEQYRALGTVEELRVAKGVYDKMYNTAKEMFKDDENRQREFREKLSKSFSRK